MPFFPGLLEGQALPGKEKLGPLAPADLQAFAPHVPTASSRAPASLHFRQGQVALLP